MINSCLLNADVFYNLNAILMLVSAEVGFHKFFLDASHIRVVRHNKKFFRMQFLILGLHSSFLLSGFDPRC